MLMNGKEVNHLIINGEIFDKSYYMRKMRFVKEVITDQGYATVNGVYIDKSFGGGVIRIGTEGTVILKYKNGYYVCVNSDIVGRYGRGFWATDDSIELMN